VPVFRQMLGALSANLAKGEAHAAEHAFDPDVLLGYRLAPDMLNLKQQVQIATDHAKGAAARLSGELPPKFDDTEASFAELRDRIARTLGYLDGKRPEDLDGSETRTVELKIGGSAMTFDGQTYLMHFALPNFFFHVTTAYAIMRHCGVRLGKRDFMRAPEA
jgi:hypothetical protein